MALLSTHNLQSFYGDFQALFGREFLKAYEAQIQKLEQQDG